MHIVICAKQVVDPDGVNSYALWGQLEVDDTGRAFQTQLPLIINAYDDQAIEAALRLRDDGHDVAITAISSGGEDVDQLLKHCKAMGCDEIVRVDDPEAGRADSLRTARLLAAAIRELGDVDLVLCGRQSSDYDQGTTPAALAELLDFAYVTVGYDVRVESSADRERLRVKRATPLGEEQVLASMPAVVTVSNELGVPRYPTSRGMMAARRHPPTVRPAAELDAGGGGPELIELFIHEVAGECEFIDGDDPAAVAAELLRRIEAEGVL
jgi:electron transfer flavoprotein beta subunit